MGRVPLPLFGGSGAEEETLFWPTGESLISGATGVTEEPAAVWGTSVELHLGQNSVYRATWSRMVCQVLEESAVTQRKP